MDLFLDIEALGLKPGAAIIEIAAVAFDPETGAVDANHFHARLAVSPFEHTDPETVAWHARKGTWPFPAEWATYLPTLALSDFAGWCRRREFGAVWSWGSTYDFPLLDAAFEFHLCEPLPWHYWQAQCARTVWNVAFPGRKHAPRPHKALEDVLAGVADLRAALAALRGKEDA